jgi:putative ABC transport system substrate-binding protein
VKRREFITFLGGAATWPLAARAQPTRLVGLLMNGNPSEPSVQANVAAFVRGLAARGWLEGKNLRLEVRWNGGTRERAQANASEIVGLAPDVILAASTTNLMAGQLATRAIPIVFLQVSDPVAQGFVKSITKPEGNITGFSAYEFSVGGKWLELLKLIAPGVMRVGVMFNPDTSPQSKFFLSAVEAAGSTFGVGVAAIPVRTSGEIEVGIKELPDKSSGLMLPTDTFTRLRQQQIAAMAAQHRVPSLSASPEFVDAGGLMFYGSGMVEQMLEQFDQAAAYVDRILKGAKPGELPIQSAAKFSLFINRKTATALGLEIPARLLFTAERVIE